MPAFQATEAEPPVQPKFSFAAALGGLILFAAIIWTDDVIGKLPNRAPVPPTIAQISLEPVELSSAGLAPLQLVGAWRLTSTGAPISGISAIAVDGEELVAITDIGLVARLPRRLGRRLQARVFDLPSGPGDARFQFNRDSEAITRDPGGRGWWIAFENRDQLWLFDRAFGRALARIEVPDSSLGRNSGIEGLAVDAGAILAFPEGGGRALRFSGGRWHEIKLDRRAPVSDAAALGSGRFLLVERRLTPLGFRNTLALAELRGSSLRTIWRKRLPVSWRDNVEGVAVERAGDGYRLWLATDDNFHTRLRTLLIVIDLPAAALPGRG